MRPTIMLGDTGPHVTLVQTCLKAAPIDGDFGVITEAAVADFQRFHGLTVDGIVGPQTWDELEDVFDLPPWPPEVIADSLVAQICATALSSPIATYEWADRGSAPSGYIAGMAVAFAIVVRKWLAGDSSALEMAQAKTNNADKDVLSWYAGVFNDLEMDNSKDGLDTLRHLFALMLGLGMRETSGEHCCGRDMSADNTDAMTCEAGLFQMSWNASSCSDEMQKLMDEYSQRPPQCALQIFEDGVTCSSDDWKSYGSGDGYHYQQLAKYCPTFAVETAAICLRNLRAHFGPINRYEAELRSEADDMFKQVQDLVVDADVPTV